MSGIYIHIPFCKQACSYCDFYFVTRDHLIPAFLDALVNEIMSDVTVPEFSSFLSRPLQSVYLGGGTPSRLSLEHLARLSNALGERFDLSQLREFTVEVNPEDLSGEYLSGLKQLGVSRLSMGVQSFQPELLEFMHRAHTSRQAHRALELVANAGFTSYSVDLIYGSPGQTLDQLQDDLRQLLPYNPPHISAYSLTIEPNTRLGKQYKLGRLDSADDEDVAAQQRLIQDTLKDHGIHRYEVSNYAKPRHEAVHNSAYWRHEDYLGLGPAAHSFFWSDDGNSAIRRSNPPDIHAYGREKNDTSTVLETLSLQTLAEERIMMGLRTRSGISETELLSRYNYSFNITGKKQIDKFRSEGLIASENPLRLTDEGFTLADAITLKLL